MSATDAVRASTVVAVDPATAFEVFTLEVDRWWRRGRRFRTSDGPSRMAFEPELGGRLLEVTDERTGECTELGRIVLWKPPERFAFEFRARNFTGNETTEVEVVFEAVASGTRVTLEHRGWDALRADHPVRHGLGRSQAFVSMMGLWWADLLVSARIHAARGSRRQG